MNIHKIKGALEKTKAPFLNLHSKNLVFTNLVFTHLVSKVSELNRLS